MSYLKTAKQKLGGSGIGLYQLLSGGTERGWTWRWHVMNMGIGRTKIQNTWQLEQRIRDFWLKHYNKSNYCSYVK